MIKLIEFLEILDSLDVLDLVESLIYKEKTLIEEMGNPTSSNYKRLVTVYELIRSSKPKANENE